MAVPIRHVAVLVPLMANLLAQLNESKAEQTACVNGNLPNEITSSICLTFPGGV